MRHESGLDEAERAFEVWRLNKRGKAIPEDLWTLAVNTASDHGVTKTAERLRLNPSRLKERLERDARDNGFVELAAGDLPLGGECVLEIESAAGSRLRLMLRGASVAAVTATARELWSATR